MSELKEKIIGPKNIRSQVIKVIILSVLLVTAFAFSVSLLTVFFGSVRNTPSDMKSDADYDDLILNEIPFPYTLEDLMSLFEDLDLDPETLEDLMETLMDMFDGDFDDIPLDDLAALMAAMLFSDVEVFRVFDYTIPVSEMEDFLWKYECYDQYSQGSWSAFDPDLDTIAFHTYADYASDPNLTDLLTVKMINLTANSGTNQFTIPTLFSSPYVIENSVSATALDTGTVTLRTQTDGLNGSALRATFTSSVDTNLTYQLAGDDLPDASEINASCVLVTSPSAEYNQLLSDYLVMDGLSMTGYMSQSHMADFQALFDYLNSSVIVSGDTAFTIANKIRNYLQYNFILNYNPMPGTEQDRINWFCQSGEGLYSDFASTFCALTRAFGVPSRFVDGFNTRFVSESFDPVEGMMGIPILYRNIYSWAEIFVPDGIDGSGNWTQFDVYYENFGGIPPIPPFVNGTFNLVVECDGISLPGHDLVNRDQSVNVTAILTNNSIPLPSALITFSDYVTGAILGTNTTDSQGVATIFIEANDSFTVGPNLIVGRYSPQVASAGAIVIDDDMIVNLNYVNPTAINVSDASNSSFTVSGNVTDPANGRGVPYSNVDFLLYRNDTSTLISNPFTPGTITADVNGIFSGVLDVSSSIYRGNYDIVANVSGSSNFTIPSLPYPLTIPLAGSAPGNSSQRVDVFIDRVTGTILHFYINDVPSTNPLLSPIVSRGSTLTLKARVLNETGNGPLSGVSVDFYDSSRGDYYIGTNTTTPLSNGWVTIPYNAGSSSIVGPNLLYARIGSTQFNYSYFILQDTVNITLTSGPTPRVVNVSDVNQFTVAGYLRDNNNSLPLNQSYLTLRMFRNTVDHTADLTMGNPIVINSDGSFNAMFSVNPSISPGNYTLRLDFNGSFNFMSNPYYSAYFNLDYINGSLDISNQLQITNYSPIKLDFWINDLPPSDYLNPAINRYQSVNLTARLTQGPTPLNGLTVNFFDYTNNSYIGSNVTDDEGYAWFIYDTGYYSVAGPHLIQATYGSYMNYSFFVLDEKINVSFDSGPTPSWVYGNHPSQATFHITGFLYDATNGLPIPFGIVETVLVEGIDSYLTNAGGSQQSLNYFGCNRTGLINAYYNITLGTPFQNYTLRFDFNGSFYYGFTYDYSSFTNFTASAIGNQIEVRDYDNVSITLYVDGYHVPYSYPDSNLPAIVRSGENITFSGTVFQSGAVAGGATVYLYDYYSSSEVAIATTIADGSGNYVFEINTSTSALHAGLHLMRIKFDTGSGIFPTFNSTYIVINETISTFTISSTSSSVTRNVDSFTVSGTLQDAGTNLRGLQVRIRLYDQSMVDRSQYLIFEPGYFLTAITDDSGYYEFQINRVNISCLQGNYDLRVEFTGSIYRSDVPIVIGMTSAMVSTNSTEWSLDVNASTFIIEDSYWASFEVPPYDDNWVLDSNLYVNGTLYWDNGSVISGVTLTIIVQYLNGTLISQNSTVSTDGSGYFLGSLLVESNWPDDRDQTEIWVSYTPLYPNVNGFQIEYTDW